MLKGTYSEIPLPSKSILTRCDMWLKIVEYYAEHIDPINYILFGLYSEVSFSIDNGEQLPMKKI